MFVLDGKISALLYCLVNMTRPQFEFFPLVNIIKVVSNDYFVVEAQGNNYSCIEH